MLFAAVLANLSYTRPKSANLIKAERAALRTANEGPWRAASAWSRNSLMPRSLGS